MDAAMSRKIAVLLMALAILSGCASTQSTDGVVKIKWHRTDNAWREAAKLGLNVNLWTINGFVYRVGDVCHVYAPDPAMKKVGGRIEYENGQWGTLGHEVKHCFDGKFHD